MKELGFHYKNWGYRATWHQKGLTIKQRSPKLVFIGLSRTSSYALFWTSFGLLRLSRWSFKKELNNITLQPPILSNFFPNFKSLWRKPKICQIILSIWIYSPKVPLIYVQEWKHPSLHPLDMQMNRWKRRGAPSLPLQDPVQHDSGGSLQGHFKSSVLLFHLPTYVDIKPICRS